MFKAIRKRVKKQDEFGKDVSLNIDGEESHKTWFGGAIAIIISGLMCVYVFLLFKKMALHEEDVLNYKYPEKSAEDLGKVPLSEMHEMTFF